MTAVPKPKPSPGGGKSRAKALPKVSPAPRAKMFTSTPKLIPAKRVYDQDYQVRLTAQAPLRVSSESSEDDSDIGGGEDVEGWE